MRNLFETLEKRQGIRVTPELLRWCTDIFELDEELRTFGRNRRRLTEFEHRAVLLLRSERAKLESDIATRKNG